MLKGLVFKPYKDSLLLKDLRTDGGTSDAATGGWGGGGCTFNPKDSGSSFPYNEALLLFLLMCMLEKQHFLSPSLNPCVPYFALNPQILNFYRSAKLFPAHLQFTPLFYAWVELALPDPPFCGRACRAREERLFHGYLGVTFSFRSKPEASDCSLSACCKQSHTYYSYSRKTLLYV